MINGLQLIIIYPFLQIYAPDNLGILQAALRKIATFELIDSDFMKEIVYGYEEEEDLDYFAQVSGFDSRIFMFSFGEPLYFFIYFALALLAIPLILFAF